MKVGDKETVLAQDQTVPPEGQAANYQFSSKPTAKYLSVSTEENKAIDIALEGSDIDGDPLNYIIVNNPLHGSVNLAGDIATYTPDLNYYGSDSFTYKASDGANDSNIATVNISVNPTIGKARIIGRAYEDRDGDGKIDLIDIFRGLSGWTIYIDVNDNGQLDSNEASTTTGLFGFYQFNNLPAGNYIVREVLKPVWLKTYPKSGKYLVTLGNNQIVLAKDFGNFKLGLISGIVFEDKNGNGRKDGKETDLANWTISLKKPDGSTITSTTNDSGNYSFTGLGPGKYTVTEVQQTGWKQTTKDPGQITITSGTNDTSGNDFGNRKK